MKNHNFSKRAISILLCVVLIFSFSFPSYAQTSISVKTPEPYGQDEFPLWAKELRRFEILSFASMPLVTMLSFWTYDIIRSIKNPGDERYYPWPLKKAGVSIPLTSIEQRNIFFTAMGISIGIALTDICVRAIIRYVREKKMVQENLLYEPIKLTPIE